MDAIMTSDPAQPDGAIPIEELRQTPPLLEALESLANRLRPTPPAELERWIGGLVAEGEDRALTTLLQVCALNTVRLAPDVLCAAIPAVESLQPIAFCFSTQDASAVEPLLRTARSDRPSHERMVLAARIAAELTVRHGLDTQPVRKVLWWLENRVSRGFGDAVIHDSLALLDGRRNAATAEVPLMTELDIRDHLERGRIHHAVGGDSMTIRRPVAKIGRNDPCPCGSGLKYKKCCMARNAEAFWDASPYAGITQSEALANPGRVGDPGIIETMRAYQLERLDPATLADAQLIFAARCAADFGLYRVALAMLREAERRRGEDFDFGHYEDLLFACLRAGDLALARDVRGAIPEGRLLPPAQVDFAFFMLEQPELFARFEQECRAALVGGAPDHHDNELIRLPHDLAPRYPALAIVMARAAIASYPERAFDIEALLDVIAESRIELDLDPRGDPAHALEGARQADGPPTGPDESAIIRHLIERLEEERAQQSRRAQELRALQEQLAALQDRPAEPAAPEPIRSPAPTAPARAGTAASSEPPPAPPVASPANDRSTVERLREQVENLKAEIRDQQRQRARLREELTDERLRARRVPPAGNGRVTGAPEEPGLQPPARTGAKLTLPEFTAPFRRRCEALDEGLVWKAVRAAVGFAARDVAIWRQAQKMERLVNHYRVRIGIHHRLLLRWDPGDQLQVLDLVPREELAAWVQRHG